MQTSNEVKELFTALSEFQAEIENPKATATNPFFKSKYATLQDTLNKARPLLAKHGLALIQSPGGNDGRITITTLITHSSGQWLRLDEISVPFDGNPQAAGSAITYLRRYSLWAALGVAGEDDDDGNVAVQNQPEAKTEEKERTAGGATVGALNFAKGKLVERGICTMSIKGESEEQTQVRRDDNKISTLQYLKDHSIPIKDEEHPLECLSAKEMYDLTEVLKTEVDEKKAVAKARDAA